MGPPAGQLFRWTGRRMCATAQWAAGWWRRTLRNSQGARHHRSVTTEATTRAVPSPVPVQPALAAPLPHVPVQPTAIPRSGCGGSSSSSDSYRRSHRVRFGGRVRRCKEPDQIAESPAEGVVGHFLEPEQFVSDSFQSVTVFTETVELEDQRVLIGAGKAPVNECDA